jgi:AmiR/NasT family two-component response regulator
VILTAFSDEEYQQEAQAIGTCGYVFKPVTAAILLPQLAAALQIFSRR